MRFLERAAENGQVRFDPSGTGHASARNQTAVAQIQWLPRLSLSLPWVGEQWHRVGRCATFKGQGHSPRNRALPSGAGCRQEPRVPRRNRGIVSLVRKDLG